MASDEAGGVMDEQRRELEIRLLEALALADALEEYVVGALLASSIERLRACKV